MSRSASCLCLQQLLHVCDWCYSSYAIYSCMLSADPFGKGGPLTGVVELCQSSVSKLHVACLCYLLCCSKWSGTSHK